MTIINKLLDEEKKLIFIFLVENFRFLYLISSDFNKVQLSKMCVLAELSHLLLRYGIENETSKRADFLICECFRPKLHSRNFVLYIYILVTLWKKVKILIKTDHILWFMLGMPPNVFFESEIIWHMTNLLVTKKGIRGR